jgi:hypothetical protein
MNLICLKPPLQEPISLEQLKNFLKIDDYNEDSLLEDLLKAARQFVEDFTERSLLEQQWRFTFSYCAEKPYTLTRGSPPGTPLLSLLRPKNPSVELRLLRTPILAINKIYFQGEDSTIYPLQKTEYQIEVDYCSTLLTLHSIRNHYRFQLVVEYTAGYGAQPQDVPAIFLQAILMKCAEWYENRGDQMLPSPHSGAAEQLLKPYRILSYVTSF